MEEFMRMAYEEAQAAARQGEVPVGAVVVQNGKVVAKARNSSCADQDMTRHAELKAVAAACSALGTPYLTDCALYVTLEPCPMCMGAVINARLGRLVYGADDYVYGACGGYITWRSIPTPRIWRYTQELCSRSARRCSAHFFKAKR